ncbi:MAG: histidine phosphatase family protein [Burkholderiales bacterium]|nr:histidine phosphatase family protein [Burkholderiales bacterium]
MGTLYLVRHGQASFGSEDYDRLSELGAQQCQRLGAHWRRRGIRFAASFSGTLRRHRQSLDAIGEGLGGLPEAEPLAGLDEYDPEALVRALYPQPPPPPDPTQAWRHHFRLLRDGLHAWVEGRTAPAGMPSHADFVAGVAAALDRARARDGGDVLIVSSGGPIATAVGLVLGLAPAAIVEINMRIRNSSVTELATTRGGHALVAFNAIPHLESADGEHWITHA